jgi:RNA polymerase sigma factor (TIGR02999 family)
MSATNRLEFPITMFIMAIPLYYWSVDGYPMEYPYPVIRIRPGVPATFIEKKTGRSAFMTETTPPQHSVGGDPFAAVNHLFEALYFELQAMAHQQLRRGLGAPALNTTALVHEAYLRFANAEQFKIGDRQHFLAYAANAMRSVVIDIMRAQRAGKRGAGAALLTLNTDVSNAVPSSADEVLRIHEALLELSAIDQALVQIVEMRYFAGLSEDEIADALQLSPRTVRRHWQKARIFLLANLTEP